MKTTEDYPQEIGFFSKLDQLPQTFADYVLDALISNGNALVFRAKQKDPQRTVALKIPKFGVLDSKRSRDQFRTEYALAAGLRHPSIVPIFEVGQWEGIPYYTMPYIEGHSLLDYVLLNKTPLSQKVILFEKICRAVSALHNEGLIHCDLKSENLMIDHYGEIALLDFGLAHVVSGISEEPDRKYVTGTIRYMAPEQAMGLGPNQLGFQTDVFALGVIGFRLFTSCFPFPIPENKSLALKAVQECEINYAPLDSIRIPFSVKVAIKRALSREVESRPSDANALLKIMSMDTLSLSFLSIINRKGSRILLSGFVLGIIFVFWSSLSLLL